MSHTEEANDPTDLIVEQSRVLRDPVPRPSRHYQTRSSTCCAGVATGDFVLANFPIGRPFTQSSFVDATSELGRGSTTYSGKTPTLCRAQEIAQGCDYLPSNCQDDRDWS